MHNPRITNGPAQTMQTKPMEELKRPTPHLTRPQVPPLPPHHEANQATPHVPIKLIEFPRSIPRTKVSPPPHEDTTQTPTAGISRSSSRRTMNRAYEDNEALKLAQSLAFEPVVPPLQTRRDPRPYDTELDWRRNEILRLIRRSKRLRRVFTCSKKTDPVSTTFETDALITDQLHDCEHALVA